MNIKSVLFTCLFSASAISFASNGVYTTVGKLEGNALVGQEATFIVNYKWLTNQARSGKVIYDVAGTNCKGEADIDKHSGLLPVSGELVIKCTFDTSAVFRSDTILQLYEGDIKKEVSEHQTGNITVTSE